MNGEKLEEATSFRYLGATISNDCSSIAEAGIRNAERGDGQIEQVMDKQLHQLSPNNSLVVSVLLYDCGTWTLQVDTGHDTGLCKQLSPKTAKHLIHWSQHRRVRPKHGSSTCLPTSRPPNDESWLGLDTSPDKNLCKRLCSKAR
ncbi:hypothetical protein DPMN_171193 [Dreissena polymorpha]|uniref:Uncharacterized protein n=1 Tax=Dreissena polymorpha TaxID=45954 RepID=A0A9D4IEY1_DREPO|nr:hypothetical protein DPMN_171193 [Dreissena polymorpha]